MLRPGIATGTVSSRVLSWGPLLKKIESGEIDPSFVITHRFPLADAPEMYKTFCDKKDGCIKVVG
jgi:threonine dehydrogenase-like Zn-dependent dehydrogenase